MTALATAAPVTSRTTWADTAKGACILLVVLWHVIMKHYLQVDWKLGVPIPGAWGAAGEQLLPLRMPLFFTISGMFAVGAVGRSWRVLARSKVAKFLYLYALWLMIHTAVLSAVPDFDTARATGPLELLEQLTITPSNLWYLYALALYFAIAKAARRVPVPVLLGAAFLLSATASAGLLDVPGNRAGVYQNLIFFLIGLHYRPLFEKLAEVATWRRLAAGAAGYAVLLGAMAALGAKTWFGVWPAVCVLATVLGVTAAALVSNWPLGSGLASLGRRTLPIYVLHMPVLAGLHWLLLEPLSTAGAGWQWVAALAEPVLLTAVVVAACLGLHRALLAARARWLFQL